MTAALAPLHRRLVVNTDPADAFRLWTSEIGLWWPVARFSVFGEDATVAFVDGVLTETAPTGETAVWGTVLAWQPGEMLRLTWHPGRSDEVVTEIEVRFSSIGVAGRDADSTLVELVHTGWERLADPMAARSEYDGGWIGVLGRYGDHSAGDRSWIVLQHSAGPAAAQAPSVFAHPLFAEHPVFLQRMRDRGVLVAAGPLASPGSAADGTAGLTILRVPTEAIDEFIALSTSDDLSVIGGLLQVRPLLWNVITATV